MVTKLVALHNQIFQIWKDELEPLEQFARRERQTGEAATQLEQLETFVDSLQEIWLDVEALTSWVQRSRLWTKKLETRKRRAEQKANRPARELPAPTAGKVDWDKQKGLPTGPANPQGGPTPNRGVAAPGAGMGQKEKARLPHRKQKAMAGK